MISKSAALLLCSQAIFVMANWQGQGCCGCGDFYNGDNGGRTFEVVSSSKPPTGLTVFSENAYEGCVEFGGKVPFVASTDVEAEAPTDGYSKVCYGCGSGQVSISREGGCAGAAGLRGCCDGGTGGCSGGTGGCSGGTGGYSGGTGGCSGGTGGYSGVTGGCSGGTGGYSGSNGFGWSVAV